MEEKDKENLHVWMATVTAILANMALDCGRVRERELLIKAYNDATHSAWPVDTQ